MRILFLCTYYHRAMIFRDSMNRLNELGHEVKAFNAVIKGESIHEKYKGIMDDAVIHKECFTKWDRFFYFRKQKKFYNALLSSCDVKNYDMLHSHTLFNGGYVAYKIKKHFGIPYIVSVRNTDMNVFLRIPFYKKISDKIIREAAGVQFLSQPYKEKFIDKYTSNDIKEHVEKKSTIIRNGLESFWLNNKAEVKRIEDKKSIKILSVCKIKKNKNLITTIKAIEKLIKMGYNVKFTVVGQVIDKNVLTCLEKSSFTNVIKFLPKEKLIDIYRDNDIYVMPSIHETFGRVYAEAMSQGLPIIYSKGEGFDGIFEDGSVGYSVPSQDPDYIADCIIKIIENYSDISSRCIEYCEEFDWEKISKKLDIFYKNAFLRAGGDAI